MIGLVPVIINYDPRSRLASAMQECPHGLGQMAYADRAGPAYKGEMSEDSPLVPPPIETIGELKQLYRDAEARAARMRLLSDSGRSLAEAEATTLDEALAQSANRLAFFLGRTGAGVARPPDVLAGLAMPSPGGSGRSLGAVRIDGVTRLADISDHEDREAVRLHLELMGLACDRVGREQERARLLATLQEREQRLEYVVGRLFAAQEEERRRVSHELHDGVAQTVTALVRMLEGGAELDRLRLAGIGRDLVRELRSVIGDLRPPLLDDLGLDAALRALAEDLRIAGFTVETRIDVGPERWPANVETAFFRVAQEAVTNIRKHANGPCEVALHLSRGGSSRPHRLMIRDHGRGGPALGSSHPPGGRGDEVGIDVMRERMAALGGELLWHAEPGRGVTVAALLPTEPD